jgi:hypothetical protein
MTNESAPPGAPHELLTVVRDLTRQVRIAQRGTWFPLLVFAVITLLAIPIHRFAPHHNGPCISGGPQGETVCWTYIPSVFVYWPIALVAAYAVIAAFYVRQSLRRGVGTPIRPFVIVGVVLAMVLGAASLWLAMHPGVPSFDAPPPTRDFADGLLTPASVIGLALLVLAWVERNRALLAYTVVYLVIVLIQANQIIHSSSRWYFLPALLIPAALLLLGSAGFARFRPAVERDPR